MDLGDIILKQPVTKGLRLNEAEYSSHRQKGDWGLWRGGWGVSV